ncbi:Hypothetical predicted protein [Octopus vulgaris]|uniref:Cns1/TTC4 wheel domain-containing protein n=1 Tax=Octopus vulgaris TaxID=6645 RepID=A0AA36BC10_OCTVU|nr:Hypothetical predicted protein [Octopus vulgaris]
MYFEPENEKLSALKEKSLKLKKIQDRDLRKQQLQERKADVLESKLFNEIHKRHIKMKTDKQNGKTILSLSDLEGSNPGGAKVYLDDAGLLHWPVLFMYPEYNQSDFIESFSENHCFSDHILEMFQSCTVPWDEEHKYVPENIEIYFEENKTESLFRIPPEKSLLEILQHENFTVIGGTPAFILLVANSKFKEMDLTIVYSILGLLVLITLVSVSFSLYVLCSRKKQRNCSIRDFMPTSSLASRSRSQGTVIL